jgi:hypothetical protein
MTNIQFKNSTTSATGPTTLLLAEPAFYSSKVGEGILWVGDQTGAPLKIYDSSVTPSSYTASNGILLTGSNFTAVALALPTPTQFPVTVATGGISVKIDNETIVSNASGALAAGVITSINGGTF